MNATSNASVASVIVVDNSSYRDLAALVIGSTFSVFSLAGMLLNIVVLAAIRRCGLWRREPNNENGNTVFLLAGVSMFDCVVRLAITGGYLGPVVLFQRRLGGAAVNYHFTQLVLVSWAVGSITEMLIGLNRLLAIKSACGSYRARRAMDTLFTRRNCIVYAVSIYPAQFIIHHMILLLTPCCKPNWSFTYYTIMFDEDAAAMTQANVFFDTIFRPVAAVCTAIPSVCYVVIFITILRHSRDRVTQHLDARTRAERRKNAYSCLQFALAYYFYFALWVGCEMEAFLPRERPYLFSMITYIAIVDMSTTAFIQATMNSTVCLVRSELLKMFKGVRGGQNRVSPTMTAALSQLRSQQSTNRQEAPHC